MKNDILAGYRRMYNIKQKDFADLLNVTSVTYSHKENGVTSFNQEEMIKIIDELKKYNEELTMDDIFYKPQKKEMN